MKIEIVDSHQIYQEAEYQDELLCSSSMELQAFQREIWGLYPILLSRLEKFGKEGSDFGESDFAIRPHPKGEAPPVRRFTLTILSCTFWRSDFLKAIKEFVTNDAPMYSIWIDQDFDSEWLVTMIFSSDRVLLYADTDKQLSIAKCRIEQL